MVLALWSSWKDNDDDDGIVTMRTLVDRGSAPFTLDRAYGQYDFDDLN